MNEPWTGTIRGAESSDLLVLEALVASSMAHPWSRRQIADSLVGSMARAKLIWQRAEEGGDRPSGFVFARRVGDLLEIDLVGVDPSQRRSGLARRLLSQLIESERAAAVSAVQLELAASNAAARSLYEGLGFVVVGARSRYYPDGEDALLLTRSFV